ncbi:ester cyclase [Caballeronia ptereochthonis]|uniref:SnoaL-like polyketide cyclase n=1 Tax=Caballeronia ptereochthonis TaxID=1777144 RepID=A0A158B7B4_9BURK|nr:ester cyclase [Caballeronia ptereochthonis]SAK65800.1 SnoaL-like polyketide cyclase [Caballeronia ptereochthonis]
MTKTALSDRYRAYIACLNAQEWASLGSFVHDALHYNGRALTLTDYREMLRKDFRDIPDLFFDIQLLIADPPRIASRLLFDCTPKAAFMGLRVDGKRVAFSENVFYEFREGKIEQVWSVIDKAAIEAQL